MRAALLVSACVVFAGCTGLPRDDAVTPVPGVLPRAGMLMRTDRIPLSDRLELRRYEIYKSDVSNDFYPYNIPRGKPAGRLTSKLFVLQADGWQFLDFVEMPLAEPFSAANVSPSGERVIYSRPDVSSGEGAWPRLYSHDRRSRQVAIYHLKTGERFVLGEITDVESLGKATFWRNGEQTLTFTARCVAKRPFIRGLVVTDGVGQVLLDGWTMPALKDLEFICHSPDGKRIAALRPVKPQVGGSLGGTLVEVTPEARTVRDVASIPSALGCNFVGRYEQLVEWTPAGECRLRKIDKPAAPPQLVPVAAPR